MEKHLEHTGRHLPGGEIATTLGVPGGLDTSLVWLLYSNVTNLAMEQILHTHFELLADLVSGPGAFKSSYEGVLGRCLFESSGFWNRNSETD